MGETSGFPFTAIRFAKDGSLDSAQEKLVPDGTTDVIVLSHGWKNDEVDAENLYSGILMNVRRAAGDGLNDHGRVWAAVGVHWPAFWFRPDLSLLTDDEDGRGGAAGLDSDDLAIEDLRSFAADMAEDLGDADRKGFAQLAVDARVGGVRADAFADRLRKLMVAEADASADVREEHGDLLVSPGRELHAALRDGGSFPTASLEGVEGSVASIGGAASFERVKQRLARLRSGGAAAIARMLNQATYYEMKARAGKVGSGLGRELRDRLPGGVRLHLVGHSFGGRVVTSAAAADHMTPIESLSLLQAAYSHNGLGTGFGDGGQTVGGFRLVIEEHRVVGPILVTHTHRDTAVGFFYALASSVTGAIANAYGLERLMGGPNDPHGGLGANGTQSMRPGEAVELVAGGAALQLAPGKVNNVLSDAIVSDHNDVANEAVGGLVWQAISTTC